MFKVKKPDKRGRNRLANMRDAFMSVDGDEPPQAAIPPDELRVPHEPDRDPDVLAEAAEPYDAGGLDEWREGDADFADISLAEVRAPPELHGDDSDASRPTPTCHRWVVPTCAEDVCVFLAGMQAKREVPIAVFSDLITYLNDNKEVVGSALAAGELPNFRTMRLRAAQTVPDVFMDVLFRDARGQPVNYTSVSAFPKKDMQQGRLSVDYVLYYVSLKSVIAFHCELHQDAEHPTFFDLSVDGIPENKSGGRSVDVLSIKFQGCKVVYSIAILQPARRGMGLSDDITVKHFLEEYFSCGLALRYVIADAPKRASLAGLKQHSSNFGCQYCVAKKVDRAYPWTTCAAAARTDTETRSIADSGVETSGVKRPSPLSSIRMLDLIHHIPAEKMHLIDLGIIRKIVQLAFKCPQFKAQQVPFARADDKQLSQGLEEAPSLPNFSRRTRALDPANYKAEEYRNLGLAYWPIVWRSIPKCAADHWLLTVFAYKSACLPDAMYTSFKERYAESELYRQWYKSFESIYGSQNCSYNPHTFHHLPAVRALGPLSATSAYDFENHYNYLKRCYRSGTASMGQQALRCLLVSSRHGHACRKKRSITGKRTRKVDDTWCYVEDAGVVRVSSSTDDVITGTPVEVEARNLMLPGLDFNDVLTFRLKQPLRLGLESTYLMRDVVGKCVVVDGYASVLTWDVLHE